MDKILPIIYYNFYYYYYINYILKFLDLKFSDYLFIFGFIYFIEYLL